MNEELNARAYRMQALLEDPDIQAAFAELEADIYAEWKACFDAPEREALWLALRALDKLQTWMRSSAGYDLTAIRRSVAEKRTYNA